MLEFEMKNWIARHNKIQKIEHNNIVKKKFETLVIDRFLYI